jgi:hypothetical protein
MTFRLTTLLYLFALVAASLAFLGAPGLLLALGVLIIWAAAFATPRTSWASWLVIAGVWFVILLLLQPPLEMGREAARQAQCRNNLKQFALSILNYHSAQDSLPPASGPRGKNNDLHSWRVVIMPYLESNTFLDLYSFDETWDGPNNNSVLAGTWNAHFLSCPTHSQSGNTTYFAINGAQTAWGDGAPRTLDGITDGLPSTILLIEAGGRGVHWAEPKDLTFDEAVDLLTQPLPADGSEGHRVDNGYFYKPSDVRHVAMCDGSFRALRVPIRREDAIALLTGSGGESVDVDLIERYSTPQLDYARVWAFSVFVVLALLPAAPSLRPWIWPYGRPQNEDVASS